MSSPYRKVLLGLRLSSVGLWLVTTAAVMMLSLALFVMVVIKGTPYQPLVALVAIYTSYAGIGLCALGLVAGFAGRCSCLPVPAAARSAPARIGLTVIFEGCSLLSAAGILLAANLIPLPWIVTLTWSLFVGLTAYLARVLFLRFARSLAAHLAPPLVREAKAVQRGYLFVPVGVLLAGAVAVAGVATRANTGIDVYEACGLALAWLIATAATVFGLIGVWRWSELLAGLRKGVMRAEVALVHSADDPDREYHARFQAAQAGGES